MGLGAFRCAVVLAMIAGALALPTSASAAPVCGERIARSIVLKADLANCPLSGLIVADANITIDLNGHTVSGNSTNDDNDPFGTSEVGIDNSEGRDGVVIKGGTITGFERGVHTGGESNVLKGLTITANTEEGVFLSNAHRSHVTRVTSTGNGGSGVFGSFSDNVVYERNRFDENDAWGMLVRGKASKVVDNKAFRNVAHGIEVRTSSEAVVRGNSIGGNELIGIFIDRGSPGTRVRSNTVDLNHGVGILVEANESLVSGNAVRGGGSGGIEASSASRQLIADNIVTENGEFGIRLNGTSRARVIGNRVRNHHVGVVTMDNPAFSDDNLDARIVNNKIQQNIVGVRLETGTSEAGVSENTVSENGFGISVEGATESRLADNVVNDSFGFFASPGVGIFVSSASADTLLLRNRSHRNTADGIDVDSASTTITKNVANDNDGIGIVAVAGVTASGNKASGNAGGNCLGVTCS